MSFTPRFHFKSARGWLNDPNGLVFLDGEYHLFFQHHPDSAVWGPMHWGHAVSTDLLEWTELPIALAPDDLGLIFSGSIVADTENRFGLSRNGETVLVAFFTHHDRTAFAAGRTDCEYQSAAMSWDKGRTWEKFQSNPVLANPGDQRDFRDPFVFWHAESDAWIMVVSAGDHVEIYRSTSLEGWTLASRFDADLPPEDRVWECPVLCRVPIEGLTDDRWVLIQSYNPGGRYGGSGTRYFVGDFDGSSFTMDPSFEQALSRLGPQWLDWGPDHYAANVWNNAPLVEGRPILIGWMNNWAYAKDTYETPFRGRMTLPRNLFLRAEENTLLLSAECSLDVPAAKVDSQRTHFPAIEDFELKRFDLVLDLSAETEQTIQFCEEERCVFSISYLQDANEIVIDRRASVPAAHPDLSDSVFRFRRISGNQFFKVSVYLSKGGAEIYFDDGRQTATLLYDPNHQINLVSTAFPTESAP